MEPLPILALDIDDQVGVYLYRDAAEAVAALCLPDLEEPVMDYYLTNGQRLEVLIAGTRRHPTVTLVPDGRDPQLDELCARLAEWFNRSGRPLLNDRPGRALVHEAIARAEPASS